MHRTATILINNYNYARFLRQAIDSALAQTYRDLEVIVVDDGSTDESRDVIRSYGDKIRLIFKENGGQASAFNAGFAAARNEIVAFLDADDYYAPHALERIVSVWGESTEIVHHRLRQIDDAGKEAGYYPPASRSLDSGDVVPLLLAQGCYGVPPTSGLVYSRKLLEKIFPMPEADFRICADSYLVSVTPFLAPVTALDETLAYYRIHGANTHRDADLRRNRQRKKLEAALKYDAMRHELIRSLAKEHGYPAPDETQWEDSKHLFDRLLLLRSSPSPETKLGGVVGMILKKIWSEPSWPLPSRLRVTILSLLLWFGPRPLLRRIYPNIFSF